MGMYEELAELALSEAERLGADYADVRAQVVRRELISVENRVLRSYESSEVLGIGVRVLISGAWGLASTTRPEREAVRETVSRAVGVARSSARRPR